MAILNEQKIDYLLEMKKIEPPLSEKTARIMLRSLRWSPEEVEHGVQFLELPPAPEDAVAPPPVKFSEPAVSVPKPPKPVSIKQNPFPIGSPLLKNARSRALRDSANRRPLVLGFIVGLVALVAGILIYMNFGGAGK